MNNSKNTDNPGGIVPPKQQVSQVFGYILIGIAIISFLILLARQQFWQVPVDVTDQIPILFFITMLGFVFIHSELLKDQNNSLSTMRIVVFMMVNIICMLMLRVGWCASSFSAMGMNGYWVTIIGFVFGGKVAQSYIENHPSPLAANAAGNNNAPDPGDGQDSQGDKTGDGGSGSGIGQADVAKFAADQNRQQLQSQFPNINSVSDTIIYNDQGAPSNVVAISVSNDDTTGMPASLTATLTDGTKTTVPTEIITNAGQPELQYLQESAVYGNNTSDEQGSIGALVTTPDIAGFVGLLTSGHIQSDGAATSAGAVLTGAARTAVDIAGADAGVWHFQLISPLQDIAVAQLNAGYQTGNYVSFKGNDCYVVGHSDLGKTQVNIVSAVSTQRTAYILDYNCPITLPYNNGISVPFTNVILIGNGTDLKNSTTVSRKGDSGGCVYVSDGSKNRLVGLILGGDKLYTYVLPVNDTLNAWNFQLL